MQPHWSGRIWDMYIEDEVVWGYFSPEWVKYASERYWSTSGKWYGY